MSKTKNTMTDTFGIELNGKLNSIILKDSEGNKISLRAVWEKAFLNVYGELEAENNILTRTNPDTPVNVQRTDRIANVYDRIKKDP